MIGGAESQPENSRTEAAEATLMAELKYDSTQYFALKGALEGILGKASYRRLKETGTLDDWRQELRRLLKAVELSVRDTVHIADPEWREEIYAELRHGQHMVGLPAEIDEILSTLSATLIKVVFLQLGFVPRSQHVERRILREGNWRLDRYRSVQYVQTEDQRRAQSEARRPRTNVEGNPVDSPPAGEP